MWDCLAQSTGAQITPALITLLRLGINRNMIDYKGLSLIGYVNPVAWLPSAFLVLGPKVPIFQP